MKKSISFNVELPELATDEQVEEWLEFNLEMNASLSGENPLIKYEWGDFKVDFLIIS